jgi:hypothetical protein
MLRAQHASHPQQQQQQHAAPRCGRWQQRLLSGRTLVVLLLLATQLSLHKVVADTIDTSGGGGGGGGGGGLGGRSGARGLRGSRERTLNTARGECDGREGIVGQTCTAAERERGENVDAKTSAAPRDTAYTSRFRSADREGHRDSSRMSEFARQLLAGRSHRRGNAADAADAPTDSTEEGAARETDDERPSSDADSSVVREHPHAREVLESVALLMADAVHFVMVTAPRDAVGLVSDPLSVVVFVAVVFTSLARTRHAQHTPLELEQAEAVEQRKREHVLRITRSKPSSIASATATATANAEAAASTVTTVDRGGGVADAGAAIVAAGGDAAAVHPHDKTRRVAAAADDDGADAAREDVDADGDTSADEGDVEVDEGDDGGDLLDGWDTEFDFAFNMPASARDFVALQGYTDISAPPPLLESLCEEFCVHAESLAREAAVSVSVNDADSDLEAVVIAQRCGVLHLLSDARRQHALDSIAHRDVDDGYVLLGSASSEIFALGASVSAATRPDGGEDASSGDGSRSAGDGGNGGADDGNHGVDWIGGGGGAVVRDTPATCCRGEDGRGGAQQQNPRTNDAIVEDTLEVIRSHGDVDLVSRVRVCMHAIACPRHSRQAPLSRPMLFRFSLFVFSPLR